VNHSVHLCIKGCFTLKFSGSWNTVICSSSPRWAFSSGVLAPSGEIGMVERSTGEAGSSLWVGASRVVAAMARVRKMRSDLLLKIKNRDEVTVRRRECMYLLSK
jgi:hypothetical protein